MPPRSPLWTPRAVLGGQLPPVGSEVDRAHPLTRGLVSYAIFNDRASADLMQRRVLAPSGTGVVRSSYRGVNGLLFDAAGEGAQYTIPASLQLVLPISIACRVIFLGTPTASAGIWGLIHNNADTNPYVVIQFHIQASTGRWQLSCNAAGSFTPLDGLTNLVLGLPYTAVGIIQTSGMALHLNGAPEVSNSTSLSNPTYGATAMLAAGNYTGVSRNSNLVIEWGAIWNRVLTAGEIDQLHASPYAHVLPPAPFRQLWIIPVDLTVVVQGSAILSDSVSLEATALKIIKGSSTLSGSVTLTGTARKIILASASLQPNATVSGTGRQIFKAAAALSASTTLAGTAEVFTAGSAALTTSAALSGAADVLHRGASALSVTPPVVQATAAPLVIRASAALALASALTGSAVRVRPAAANLATQVILTGDGQAVKQGTASVSATINLTAAGIQQSKASATLTTGVALTGVGHKIVKAAGALSTTAVLSAVSAARISGAADVSFSVALTATGRRVVAGIGTLTTGVALTATARKIIKAATALSVSPVVLAVNARVIKRGSVALAFTPNLSGVGNRIAVGSSALSLSVNLAGVGKRIAVGYVAYTLQVNLAPAARLQIRSAGVLSLAPVLIGFGHVVGQAHTGRADLAFTVALAASGKTIVRAAAALNLSASVIAQGRRVTLGSVALSGLSVEIVAIARMKILAVATLSQGGFLLVASGLSVVDGSAELVFPLWLLTGTGFTGPLVDIDYPTFPQLGDSSRRVSIAGGNRRVTVTGGKTTGVLN